MPRLALLVFLLSAVTQPCFSSLPGVKVRLTKPGIDYANKVVYAELVKELKSLSIPDQSGHDGILSYTLTSIHVTAISPPTSSVSVAAKKNGVTWELDKLSISIHANWKAELKEGIIKISTSGSVDATASGMNLMETASFGIDHTGRPSITSSGCSSSVGGVSVTFHGGISKVVNLFRHTVEDKVKDILPSKVCGAVVDLVNKNAEKALASLPVTIEVVDRFLIDYRLTSSPNITDDYIELYDKGEVFWKADVKEAPFVPGLFPVWTNNSRHLYVWVSEYAPNTFLYEAHTHDYLRYNVTKKDLPKNYNSYLNTTCQLKCVGTIIPSVGRKYPNSTVELGFQTLEAPTAIITNKTLTVNVKTLVTMWAQTPSNVTAYLATLTVNASLTAQPSVNNERLKGVITDHTFKLSVVKSAIGHLFPAVYNTVIEGILTIVVIPRLNSLAAKGVQLPIVDGVQLNNTAILLQEKYLLVATDVMYKSIQSYNFLT